MLFEKFYLTLTLLILSITLTNSDSTITPQYNEQTYSANSQAICESVCPPSKGVCRGGRCNCLDGYITAIDENNHLQCNYDQKNMLYSLLLESFGLIGFGHFYAGRVMPGLIKFIVFYIIICFGTQFVISFMKEDHDTDTAYYVKLLISAACLGFPVVWHIIDLYKFATNQYLDGNGQPMKDW
jgi:hypothetical protein